MRTIYLDGLNMAEIEEAYVYLAKELGFPDYYGKNLDALFDCLTEFCSDAFIVINNSKAVNKAITKVFLDAASETGTYIIFR